MARTLPSDTEPSEGTGAAAPAAGVREAVPQRENTNPGLGQPPTFNDTDPTPMVIGDHAREEHPRGDPDSPPPASARRPRPPKDSIDEMFEQLSKQPRKIPTHIPPAVDAHYVAPHAPPAPRDAGTSGAPVVLEGDTTQPPSGRPNAGEQPRMASRARWPFIAAATALGLVAIGLAARAFVGSDTPDRSPKPSSTAVATSSATINVSAEPAPLAPPPAASIALSATPSVIPSVIPSPPPSSPPRARPQGPEPKRAPNVSPDEANLLPRHP